MKARITWQEPERLPSQGEIADDDYNSPDKGHAIRTFLGKTLEQAELLFASWNSLGRMESLTWMKATGFRFYVHAAMRYILSCRADRDPDVVSSMHNVLKRKLKSEPEELAPIASNLAAFCELVSAEFTRFEADVEIYGDLQSSYSKLATEFNHMSKTV